MIESHIVVAYVLLMVKVKHNSQWNNTLLCPLIQRPKETNVQAAVRMETLLCPQQIVDMGNKKVLLVDHLEEY